MISTVTLNPAFDKSIYIDKLIPNDTNRIIKVETDAGGKGINASRVLKELGSETVALGFLGGDTGRFIEQVLISNGIQTDFVHIDSPTRTVIGVQEASGAPPTTFNEPGAPVTEDEFDELSAKVRRTARKSTMMAFGGSLPPGAPVDTYRKLVTLARNAGTRVILDSDGEPMRLGIEARPYMIKPNRAEVERLIGVKIESLDDAVKALRMFEQFDIETVVISMGSQGAVACSQEGVWHAIPPEVKVVSTIGAGDSMVAGIAHILSKGGSLEEALRWGSAAGAATAMTSGAEISGRPQILALIDKVHVTRLD